MNRAGNSMNPPFEALRGELFRRHTGQTSPGGNGFSAPQKGWHHQRLQTRHRRQILRPLITRATPTHHQTRCRRCRPAPPTQQLNGQSGRGHGFGDIIPQAAKYWRRNSMASWSFSCEAAFDQVATLGGSVEQLSSVSESNGRSAIGLTPHVNPPIRRAEDVGLTRLFIGFMVRLTLKEKPASLNLLLKNSVTYYDAQEGSRHSAAAVLPSSNRRLL